MRVLTISGNCGSDAELRSTPSGKELCEFSVATSNNKNETTVWVKCAFWGARGVALVPHIKKGSNVVATGEMSLNEHDGKTYVNMNVSSFSFGGGSQNDTAQQHKATGKMAAQPQSETAGGDGFDDDIPF